MARLVGRTRSYNTWMIVLLAAVAVVVIFLLLWLTSGDSTSMLADTALA